MTLEPSNPERPALRVGHADRERTIDILKVATGEGRLTVEELEERIEAASNARYQSDLDVLIADLPAGQPKEAPPAPNVVVAGVVPQLPPGTPELYAGWKRVVRAGHWRVPSWMAVNPSWESIVLNMLEAIPPDDGVINVMLRGSLGNLVIIVPDGWGVNYDSLTHDWSSWAVQSAGIPSQAVPGKPQIHLWGRSGTGWIIIRTVRWWDSWFNSKTKN